MTSRKKVIIISLLFILLFLYTGISKLADLSAFNGQLKEIPFVKPVAGWLTWLIPLSEVTLAALLAIPRYRLMGLYGSLELMAAFTIYVIVLSIKDPFLPCGCGNLLDELPPAAHIAVNVLLMVFALAGILLKRNSTLSAPAREGMRNTDH